MKWIVIKRDDLHKEIWERPLSHVATKYGISDVGLGKICRRLGVPKPAVGYWAKREAGHHVEIPPLPPASGEIENAVQIPIREKRRDIKLIPEPAVAVPVQLRNPHPLVQKTREELHKATTDDYGRLAPRDHRGLTIRVSKAQLSRALRIAGALIRALERLGWSVELRGNWNSQVETFAVVHGEAVRFSIWELSRQSIEPGDGSLLSRDRRTYTPTGCLELRIDQYVSTGRSKTTRDRPPKKAIEDALGRFIVSLDAAAKVMHLERQKRQEQERLRQIALADRRRREREAAYERSLQDDLVAKASAHREARSVREFLEAFEQSREGRLTQQDREWLSWAHAKADRRDPLSNGSACSSPLSIPDEWEAGPRIAQSWGSATR